jgi:RNA polymerase sigma factor (sigma-70 family)
LSEAVERAIDARSDATLITAVRRGDTTAYGVLYERHLGAAKRAAACLATTAAEREDLVAEAFTRVLQVLRAGNGPVEEFRPYLLVTMRHAAINAARRAPALTLYSDIPDTASDEDPVAARLSGRDAASAFAGLPERWRMVLWHTEVEGESPAEIAPLLGMTPNGVAALAYRAREGLRQAYLRMHLPATEARDCRAATDKLAGWVRRSISAPQRRKISAHLSRCARCRELADGLTELNGELRAIVAPLVLGASLASAYVKTATASGVGVAGFVSWLSGVKATLTVSTAQAGAAAAIATVTAVTAIASDPLLAIEGHNHGTGMAAPPPPAPATRITDTPVRPEPVLPPIVRFPATPPPAQPSATPNPQPAKPVKPAKSNGNQANKGQNGKHGTANNGNHFGWFTPANAHTAKPGQAKKSAH